MMRLTPKAVLLGALLILAGCQSGQPGSAKPTVEPGPGRVVGPEPTSPRRTQLDAQSIDAIAALDGLTPFEVATRLSAILESAGLTQTKPETVAAALDQQLTIRCDSSCRIQKRR